MVVALAIGSAVPTSADPLTFEDLLLALDAVEHPRLWPTECEPEMQRAAAAESILENYPANPPAISESPGEEPVYFVLFDLITLPTPSESCTVAMYYHTLYHELAHSTRDNRRLGRDLDYADEEIVAELTAIVLTRHTRFESDLRHTKHVLNRYHAVEADLRRLWPEATKAASYILARDSQPSEPHQGPTSADARAYADSTAGVNQSGALLRWAHLDPRIVSASSRYVP
jgi:antirestriction protein ArdC